MEEFAQQIHPDDRERVTAALTNAVAGTAPYDLEFRILRTDEEVRTLRAQGEVIRDEWGEPIRIVGEGVIGILRRTIPENIRLGLAIEPEDTAPLTVKADPTRIRQALMNLATNARDAMLPKGGNCASDLIA